MSELNGYLSPFIDDGMEGEFTVPAVDGRWSEVKGNYRPYCAADESAAYAKSQIFPGVGTVKYFAELFAQKIKGWNIKDAKGQAVPITADNIGKLDPDFFAILKETLKQPVEQPKN